MLPKKEISDRFTARIFSALSDPIRLEILEYLRGGEKCVCEIVPHVGLIQPLVSRHLKILKDCGMVEGKKEGNRRIYSVTDREIFDVIDQVTPQLIRNLSKRLIKQIAC
jgi:ArsR family transcriptional regulator